MLLVEDRLVGAVVLEQEKRKTGGTTKSVIAFLSQCGMKRFFCCYGLFYDIRSILCQLN